MLKKFAILLVSLVVACVVLIGLLIALVDPNDYRDEISAIARETAGVELTLGGDLGWSFYPVLGLNAAGVAVALQPGAPTLVSIQSVDFGVKLLPLFAGRIEIDALAVQGLEADLLVDKDGNNNFTLPEQPGHPQPAPAQAPAAPAPADYALVIPLVQVTDARIHYRDLRTDANYSVELSRAQLRDVNLSEPFPILVDALVRDNAGMAIALQLDSQLALNPDSGVYRVNPLNLALTVEGVTPQPLQVSLQGQASFNQPADSAVLDLPRVTLANMTSSLALNATGVSDAPVYSGRLDTGSFDARALATTLGVALPAMSDPAALGRVSWQLPFKGDLKSVRVAPLSAQLDDSTLQGELAVTDFSRQALRFALALDRMDIDRYTAPAAEATSAPATGPAPDTGSDEELLPTELLRGLDIRGSFTAGELLASGISLRDLVVDVVADRGEVEMDVRGANLLGGTLTGKVGVDARAAEPRLATQFNASGIGIGELLKPFTGVEVLTGRTSLALDSHSQGNTLDSLLRAALGQIDLQMQDAIVHGINVNQLALDKIRDQLVDVTALYPDYQSKLPTELTSDTEINELVAKLRIENGQLIVPETRAKSSDGSLNLAGNIDLLQRGLDLRFDIVLDALSSNKYLKNTAWPVHCKGQWQDPVLSWCRPDSKAFNTTLQNTLKQAMRDKSAGKIADKLGLEGEDEASLEQQARDKAKAEEDRAKQKLKDALDKKLKGLFN